jgi:hypothetical protein
MLAAKCPPQMLARTGFGFWCVAQVAQPRQPIQRVAVLILQDRLLDGSKCTHQMVTKHCVLSKMKLKGRQILITVKAS